MLDKYGSLKECLLLLVLSVIWQVKFNYNYKQ